MEKDRRQHKRIAVMHDLAKEIDFSIEHEEWKKHRLHDKSPRHVHCEMHVKVPAVLLNLAAGGMGLLTFSPVPIGTKILLNFDLLGLQLHDIEAKIVWSIDKGETHRMGIQFSKIAEHASTKLEKMAQDDTDCDTKLSLGVTDVCFTNCHYYKLCTKKYKLKD
jgi:hypothetical protein